MRSLITLLTNVSQLRNNAWVAVVIGALLWVVQPMAAVEAVPPEYADVDLLVQSKIAAFDAKLDAQWDGQKYAVSFSAELLSANGNRGLDLLQTNAFLGIQYEMTRLQTLGVKCLTISIPSPLLSKSYYDNFLKPSFDQYTAIVNLYKAVVADARSRGMKVLIESGPIFTTPGVADDNMRAAEFYGLLNGAQYAYVRTETLKAIVTQLHPDYLQMGAEPDTEELETGFAVGNPTNWKALVDYALTELGKVDTTGVLIGAGIGSWNPQYVAFVDQYKLTSLDFIDIHIYPSNVACLDNAIAIADMAAAAGKKVTVSEAWLYKSRDSELNGVAATTTMFQRDAWEFWQPDDIRFLQAMVKFAHAKKLEVMSPFWSKYFYAYLLYADVKTKTDQETMQLSSAAAATAIVNGTFTGTGQAYRTMMDGVVPGAPGSLTVTPMSPTQLQLAWSAGTDNYAVMEYRVYRDGVFVGKTTGLNFIDSNLMPGTPYRYRVLAVDNAYNASIPSSFGAASTTVTTKGVVTPMTVCTDAQSDHVAGIRLLRPGVRPRFSPDGSRLVFDRINADGFYDLYLMDSAGHITQALTEGNKLIHQRHNGNGIYAPNGQFIVFCSEEPTHYSTAQTYLGEPGLGLFNNLWAITPDGQKAWQLNSIPLKQTLSDGISVYASVNPHFTHDGRSLVWTERYAEGANWGYWRIKIADFKVVAGVPSISNERVLFQASTVGGSYVTAMGFLPGNRYLMLAGNLDGQHEYGMDQYKYDTVTGALINLTNTAGYWEEDSSLTQDGLQNVYMSNCASTYPLDFANYAWAQQPRERDYFLMNIDGSSPEQLSYFNLSGAPEFFWGRSIVAASDLSPDDRTLAGTLGLDFGTLTTADHVLYVMVADVNLTGKAVPPSTGGGGGGSGGGGKKSGACTLSTGDLDCTAAGVLPWLVTFTALVVLGARIRRRRPVCD